ncbi:hypothetical protein [Micrococcus sp.]|uniref:hypothetical protein n=1 Tax=Micrococcus sp. TaxID=1271 RepID=UPI002A90EA79|nr:hypothetical protein [Micrococcus sp.]MDY6054855.1 hypothetical protein [Micrococcus sp.]
MGILSGLTRALSGTPQRGRTTGYGRGGYGQRGYGRPTRGRGGVSPLVGMVGGVLLNQLARRGGGRYGRGAAYGRRRGGGLAGGLLGAGLGSLLGRRRRY